MKKTYVVAPFGARDIPRIDHGDLCTATMYLTWFDGSGVDVCIYQLRAGRLSAHDKPECVCHV